MLCFLPIKRCSSGAPQHQDCQHQDGSSGVDVDDDVDVDHSQVDVVELKMNLESKTHNITLGI